jgi:ribosomal protein L30E
MAREKEYFRDVVADIIERTGKTLLGVNDIKKYLKIGHTKAIVYLEGKKTITVYQFAQKLI